MSIMASEGAGKAKRSYNVADDLREASMADISQFFDKFYQQKEYNELADAPSRQLGE